MPILDPSSQYAITFLADVSNPKNAIRFYLRYLLVASRNIYRNYDTFNCSKITKIDICTHYLKFNEKFGCELNEEDFSKATITDYYKFLYDSIVKNANTDSQITKKSKNGKNMSQKLYGKYIKLYNLNIETYYFIPNLLSIGYRSWMLTDSSFAILSLDGAIKKDDFPIILLEIDLMKAAGFTLVLCANYPCCESDQIFELIGRNQFSEIHINIFSNLVNIEKFLENSGKNDHFIQNKGYVYLYSNFISKEDSKTKLKLKELLKIKRIKTFFFSNKLEKSIKKPILQTVNPFVYCKNGFVHKKLRVFLTNVPLYDADFNGKPKSIPSEGSGFCVCHVPSESFLNWQDDLIEIVVENRQENKCFVKYVKYEDIHEVSHDIFLKDQLAIAKVKPKLIQKVNKIEKNIKKIIEERKNKKFRRRSSFSISSENQIKNQIENATYAYTHYAHSLNEEFSIHRPQVYTVFEACKMLLSKEQMELAQMENNLRNVKNFLSFKTDQKAEESECSSSLHSRILSFLTKNFALSKSSFTKKGIQFIYTRLLNKPKNYLEEVAANNYSHFLKTLSASEQDSLEQVLLKAKENIEKQISSYKKVNHKGIIYQVETGEGKSCIIALIAAILAKRGKTVHITSSNIQLANRDYMNSYEFFKLLGLKSAVLLHENELPISSKRAKELFKKNKEEEISRRKSWGSFGSFKKQKASKVMAKDVKFDLEITKSKTTDDLKSKDWTDSTDKSDNLNSVGVDINEHDFFKKNMDKYYEYHTRDDRSEYAKYYKNDYYDPKEFKNPTKMNFGVCGVDHNNDIPKNKPNIIFSTFVNFECFYLKMMEICPGYIDEYYSNCALLIDEADSILIDEITNGTIISREVKSGSKKILEFVYDQKIKNMEVEKNYREKNASEEQIKEIIEKSIQETYDEIKKNPKCIDITLQDVRRMYSEIELVQKDEFTHGKKYIIDTYEVKNYKKKNKLMKQALNVAKNILIKVGKGLVKEMKNINKNDNKDDENEDDKDEEDEDDDDDDDDEDEDDDEDDDDDEDEEEEENENEDKGSSTVFRQIIPFDYDHKGILEPNKEFGGFIQQFIAIKESKEEENKNMIVKDLSVSYLYVSHPIFVKLYSKVCGFTGTVGQKEDKKIYEEHYDLVTLKIPRNEVNHRVEFPMILCKDIKERDKRIVLEILDFHQRGNPVLVIFQDLTEISNIFYMLVLKGISNINVFDGRNEDVRPDKIAGENNTVSLGTNVCGRGTNIIAKNKPLHVIISYYTSNKRVMDQARGRTARQGKKGTCHIICTKDQFINPTTRDESGIETALEEFNIKNQMQKEFISHYMESKPWAFSNEIGKQSLDRDQIQKMRSTRINVNRIVAYNCEFPLNMKVDTFLDIQAQKIFSLLNCPNCMYTWRLFQRYVREMILEAWSLQVNHFDEDFFNREENIEYQKALQKLKDYQDEKKISVRSIEYQEKRKELNKIYGKNIINYQAELKRKKDEVINQLSEYLPKKLHHIVPSFMFIFDKVVAKYESEIINSFNPNSNVYFQHNGIEFFSCQIGFKPYSLLSESGARINYNNLHKANYIKDPELKYIKQKPNNKFSWLSITEKIDDIFNSIFQRINQILGNLTFLKLFMRRTLFGCEFGVCLDFPTENNEFVDPKCIIDKDPLLVFTVSVKSIIPVLAGVLIILLVYIASIAKDIGKWFSGVPAFAEILKKSISVVINVFAKELVGFALDKIIKLLSKTLNKQIEKLEKHKSEKTGLFTSIIKCIMYIINSKSGEKINKKFSSFLGSKIKVKANWHKLIKNCFDIERILKISFLLLLCCATFIMNFCFRKDAIKHAKEDAKEYDNSIDSIENNEKNSNEKKMHEVEKVITNLSEKNEKEVEKEEIKDVVGESDDEDENFAAPKKKLTKKEKEKMIVHKKQHDIEMKAKLQLKSEEEAETYLFKLKSCNPFEEVKRITDYIDEKIEQIDEIQEVVDLSNGVAVIKNVIQKGKPQNKLLKFHYSGLKKFFIQQMCMYATNKLPSILQVVGYRIGKNKQDIYVKSKEGGTLESCLCQPINMINDDVKRLIIAYGIAQAMLHLHTNNIVHRNLKPAVIFLDSKLHPYLSEFYYARQIDLKDKYEYSLVEVSPEYCPPEFMDDPESNQNSFEMDVYAYGMTLFSLVTGKKPFEGFSEAEIVIKVSNGKRPDFNNNKNINECWKKLIHKCWNQDPKERPTFKEIVENFDSDSKSFYDTKCSKGRLFDSYKHLFTKTSKNKSILFRGKKVLKANSVIRENQS